MKAEARSRAVILLSGGMDSATCLAIAQGEGLDVTALTVDYGQRHRLEIERARALARSRGVTDHRVVQVDLRSIGGSALTAEIEVPKDRPAQALAAEIPPTYVPARNTLLLALALGLAEVVDARAIYIGATAVDYSGYPDCRPEFLRAFEVLARLGTVRGIGGDPVEIRAPLLAMSKAEIVRAGSALGIDYGLTSSCYDPSPEGASCGRCDACQLRRKGFAEAGIEDPAQTWPTEGKTRMANWKTERSYAGKSAKEVYQATKRVIDELSGKYGLKHQGNDTSLSGTVNRMGVDGTYRAVGDTMTIELAYGFLIPGAVRQKVQDEVTRQLDKLFA